MNPVLLGFSTHTSIVFDLLHDLGFRGQVTIVKNIPVDESYAPFEVDGLEVIRASLDEYEIGADDDFIFAVTKPAVKRIIAAELEAKPGYTPRPFPRLIHSSAMVAPTATVGPGSIIEQGVILAPYASIGSGVNVKRGANIGHHTVVGDYATINPGVTVSGTCRIGADCAIGVGTTIYDQIEIGAGTIVAGGSVVRKSLPPNVIASGNPCRIVKDSNS